VWDRVLDDLRLRGDETLLDLGCGRGAVLLAAAKRLPQGRAIGVDIWQADQTGNSQQATLANAELEDVAGRIELHTADMTALPLSDESVDVVVSNLAIHNIPTRADRRLALDQAVRVLRPGGRLAIADLWETRQHAEHLRELGWRNVRRRNLGWRMWYGGPWFSTRLVTAIKPA
jgi:ubiquinone/menaquinone biosynthesis C-methylase UbiE